MMSCFPSLLGAFFSELPTLEEVEKTSQKLLFWRPKKALISNSIESLLNFSPPDRRAEWLELGLKAVLGWYLGRKRRAYTQFKVELLGTWSFPLSSLWLPNNRPGEPRTRFEFVITFRESRSFKSSFCLLSRSLCCLTVCLLRGLYRFSNFPIGPNLVPVPFCRFRESFFPKLWGSNLKWK